MDKIAVAIDIGTSNSKVAVFKDGKIQLVPNAIGDTSTPSVVAILDEGEEIGEETLMSNSDEKHTIIEIKRLLGKNISDLKDLKRLNYDILGDMDKLQIKVNRKGKDEFFTPEQILSLFFKKLMKNASDFMGTKSPITKAVITVPVYFDSKQKSAMEESAKKAGIEVIGIINEPTAAALAYGLGIKEDLSDSIHMSIMKKDNVSIRKVLVFDFGGGYLDISVLLIDKTNFNVKAYSGDNNLGGIDFDYKLIDYCIKNFCQITNNNENDVRKDLEAMKRLKTQAIKAKKQLSKNDTTNIFIYNFFNNCDLNLDITRNKFNDECNDLFKKIENNLDKVLKESNFTSDSFDDVIIVGGASKMPRIKEIILEKKFNPSKIRENINPDEAVVIGATWQAHKLAKNPKILSIFEINPSPLGISVISKLADERAIGPIMSVLIKKGETLPAKSKIKEYKTIKDNQLYFKIRVYSGEDRYVKHNRFLGMIKLDNLPKGKAGTVELSINFEVDAFGILTVNAEVKSTDIKETRKYPIYNKDDEKKGAPIVSINEFEKAPTIIKLNKNTETKKKLNVIKDLTQNIKNKNKELIQANDNDKKNILEQLCKDCSEIIEIYENLRKGNENSETLYEKKMEYTKLLLQYYSQMIVYEKNNKEIIEKIQSELSKYINDNVEFLLDDLIEIKNKKPKIFIEIILFIIEKIYIEGDKYLEDMKQYARYNSKKLYQKAEKIKKIIDDNLKKEMNGSLENKYNEIQKTYGKKVEEINSFSFIIKNLIEKKVVNIFHTGGTIIGEKVKKFINKDALDLVDITIPGNAYLILDFFEEMRNSLSKGPPTEEEAYCIANIIKINFQLFENNDFKLYEELNNRIKLLLRKIDKDEGDEPEWYKELELINEQIKIKKEEKEVKTTTIINNNNKLIDEIKEVFENKMKGGKKLEFLHYLIDKFPFSKIQDYNIEELKKQSFEDLFQLVFPLYHPDNYKDRNDYIIYHEIYILLVNIEKQEKQKNN